MMDDDQNLPDDEILPEYSLRGGVRGKYADRYPRAASPARPDSAQAAASRDDDHQVPED
jgi:hypothetical protein